MTSKQERNTLLDMSVEESSSESCDLELSYSSSEFETNDLESGKGITPFLYEPEASETDADIASSPEDSEEEDGSERVGNTEWYNMNYNGKIEWLPLFPLLYLEVYLWTLCGDANCSRKHLLRRTQEDSRKKGRRGSTLHHNTSRVSVSLSGCLGTSNCILFLAAALRKRCSSGNCTTVSLNC